MSRVNIIVTRFRSLRFYVESNGKFKLKTHATLKKEK
jgi:hypothetical protein